MTWLNPSEVRDLRQWEYCLGVGVITRGHDRDV